MKALDNFSKSDLLLALGFILLLSSMILPVFYGFIFAEEVLQGWQVFLFTAAGLFSISEGGLETVLGVIFIINLLLAGSFILYFRSHPLIRWYNAFLALALLFILTVGPLGGYPGTPAPGFYSYILSYILIGAAFHLKFSKQADTSV